MTFSSTKLDAAPETIDTDKIIAVLDRFHRKEGHLIAILQEIQALYRYLPREALDLVSSELNISPTQVYHVATFFRAFSLKPRGKHLLQVCLGTACHVRGAVMIKEKVEEKLCVQAGETTEDRNFTLETVNCVGACALGPVVIIDGEYKGNLDTNKVVHLLEKFN